MEREREVSFMCLGGTLISFEKETERVENRGRERKNHSVDVRVILATAHSCWGHDEISVLG